MPRHRALNRRASGTISACLSSNMFNVRATKTSPDKPQHTPFCPSTLPILEYKRWFAASLAQLGDTKDRKKETLKDSDSTSCLTTRRHSPHPQSANKLRVGLASILQKFSLSIGANARRLNILEAASLKKIHSNLTNYPQGSNLTNQEPDQFHPQALFQASKSRTLNPLFYFGRQNLLCEIRDI